MFRPADDLLSAPEPSPLVICLSSSSSASDAFGLFFLNNRTALSDATVPSTDDFLLSRAAELLRDERADAFRDPLADPRVPLADALEDAIDTLSASGCDATATGDGAAAISSRTFSSGVVFLGTGAGERG